MVSEHKLANSERCQRRKWIVFRPTVDFVTIKNIFVRQANSDNFYYLNENLELSSESIIKKYLISFSANLYNNI